MKICLTLLILLTLGGCAVKGEYSCGIPDNGVRCQPMNETHQQLRDGTLTSLHTDPYPEEDIDPAEQDSLDFSEVESDPSDPVAGASGPETREQVGTPSILSIRAKQAVLSAPREMRIWFNRFTDPDGDLHDESFVFVRIDNGHWTIDDKPVLY